MPTMSQVLYRGERDGELRAENGHPFFFAEDHGQAKLYAGRTDPLACVLSVRRLLDLTQIDYRDSEMRALVDAVTQEFDEWIDRYSGEPRTLLEFLETGSLYDYEGTGSGTRWNKLFNIAFNMGYDTVRVLDCTDGTNHRATPVWAVKSRQQIRMATLGERLADEIGRLEGEGETAESEFERQLSNRHSDLLERINRLCIIDDEYRLDNVHNIVPRDMVAQMSFDPAERHTEVWRGLPKGKNIRPGDWVTMSKSYAQKHQREVKADHGGVKSLPMVLTSDVYWAGTDQNEFFYLPAAWRKQCRGPLEYLKLLTSEQIRILCDGEQARITEHAQRISAIESHVLDNHDEHACGVFHGPQHWYRVQGHGHAVARSLGIDPLIPHIFGLVHDSQREDESVDPWHGHRAAKFINENRAGLFSFLSDLEVEQLAHACELHSEGHTVSHQPAMACWDADRLDLWRVGIEPSPRHLCTSYAREADVIEAACRQMDAAEQNVGREEFRF